MSAGARLIWRGAPLLLLCLAACGSEDAREAVAATLADPASAQFQAVTDRGDHVCGEVNSRTAGGGYSGYTRFVYDKRGSSALVDPRLSREAAAAQADSACAKAFAYQTVEERLACAQRPIARSEANLQSAFDTLWSRVCA